MASSPADKSAKTDKPKADKPAKPDKQVSADQESAAPAGRRGLPWKTLAIAGGVLLMEAATVVTMMMVNKGPSSAAGSSVAEKSPLAPTEDVEVLILEGKAANTKRGITYVYRFKVHAVLDKKDEANVNSTLEKHKAAVEDSVRQVVARLDPKDLDEEPKLVTFRRVLMGELEPVVGANKIKQLLVPEWSRIRVD